MHQHRCRNCNPEMLPPPTGPRQGPHHYSIRFPGGARCVSKVTVDGLDVTRNCYEALGGDPGTAWIYMNDDTGHKHLCCRSLIRQADEKLYPCEAVLTGKVEVVERPEHRASDSTVLHDLANHLTRTADDLAQRGYTYWATHLRRDAEILLEWPAPSAARKEQSKPPVEQTAESWSC